MNPSAAQIREIPKTELTVGLIAEKLGAELHGDSQKLITGIKPLESASATELSFVTASKSGSDESAENAKKTAAGALLVTKFSADLSAAQIITEDPMGAVITLAALFYRPPTTEPGIHSQAVVDHSATIGENVSVGAFCVIGKNVHIGNDTIIHPHVVIYEGVVIGCSSVIHSGAVVREYVRIGSDCRIQNGVVVGGDGFGYLPDKTCGHRRIPHIGTVILKDGVDLGANSTIDRGTLGETLINESTKIDNLVMVGHNVNIGKRSLLCGQVGISGSCNIGSDVILGGQVGVADHITIGNKVRAGAKTGIGGSVRSNSDIGGYPQLEFSLWRKVSASLKNLPTLTKRVRKIEKQLEVRNSLSQSEETGPVDAYVKK